MAEETVHQTRDEQRASTASRPISTRQRKRKVHVQTHPISGAVRELRNALGETQQQFANRMKTAIRTIARWETIQRPRGKVLGDFVRIANAAKRPDIAVLFERAQTAELSIDHFTHKNSLHFEQGSDGSHWGFLGLWFEGLDQKEFVLRFRDAITALHQQNEKPERREAFRQALGDFAERAAKIREA